MAGAQQDDLLALYQQLILDHARQPRNFGALENKTSEARGVNSLCGDVLNLYLAMDGRTIDRAGFEGSGCAISIASASLLTETVAGLSAGEALALVETVTARLRGERVHQRDDTDKLAALDGVREYPSRVKCATLAWRTLEAALGASQQTVTTE